MTLLLRLAVAFPSRAPVEEDLALSSMPMVERSSTMKDLVAGRDVAAAEDGGAADGSRLGGDGLAGRRIHPRRVRQAAAEREEA